MLTMVEETYDVEFDESNSFQGAYVDVVDIDEESLVEAMINIPIGDIKPNDVEDEVQNIDQPSTSMAPHVGSEQDDSFPNGDVHVPQEQVEEQTQDVDAPVQAPSSGTSKRKSTHKWKPQRAHNW